MRRMRSTYGGTFIALAVLWSSLLVFEVLTLRRVVGGEYSRELSDWLYYAVMGMSAIAVFVRVVVRPRARLAWALIGAGIAAWLAGDVAFSVQAGQPGRVPFPGAAEAFYLSQYVLLLLGLWAMGARLRRRPDSLSLLVGLMGLATVWSWLVFGRVVESASGDTAEVAVTLAYPLLDLVLLAATALALAARDWRLDAAFGCLVVGFGVLAVGDMVYAVQEAQGTYGVMSLVNVTWPVAASIVALAAWLHETSPGEGADGRKLIPALTTTMALLGAGVLIWDHFDPLDSVTIAFAIATMVASVVQMGVLFLSHESAQRRASASEALRSASTEGALDCVVSFDSDGVIHEWNEAARHTFGLTREEAIGSSVGDLIVPPVSTASLRDVTTEIGRLQPGRVNERLELTARRAGGGTFPIETAVTRVQESPAMFTAYARDITDRRRREEENERLAAIVRSSEDAIVSLDLRGRITAWNRGAQAIYGYSAGEAIGRPIGTLTVPPDRRGEVERMVAEVLESGSAELETQRVAKSGDVVDVAVRAFPIRSLEGEVIGVSTSAHDLTERRRRERRELREQGRRLWRERIRSALGEDRLRFWAQPVVAIASGRVHHHELLLRMELDGKVVTPNVFLPHAEETELIGEIDRWAIARGCQLACASPVAINLSARSLSNPNLPDVVQETIDATGAKPGDVIFEITETAAAENLESASTLVGRLRDLGCGVALDDFGTGYGSFTYLKYLQVTQLKIDITFIRDLARDAVDRRVVNSIVAVADNFGMQTVAEGVEDEQTVVLLGEMGVDLVQGFHLGRPVPAEMAVPAAAASRRRAVAGTA